MIKHVLNDLEFFSFESFGRFPEVTNVAVSRKGGSSGGEFAELNLSLNAGDDPDVVLDNRARLSFVTGASPDLLTLGGQVHGVNVAVVPDDGIGGGGSGRFIPETDAMVTRAPDVPLVILAADCVAVSLYDPENGAAGIAHAGWKGTLGSIAARTVDKMKSEFGSDPASLHAGIGPSIGPCCYEVGEDVIGRFYAADRVTADEVLRAGKQRGTASLDLWKANKLVLESAGVPPENIEVAGLCTACNPEDFYSHRAEGGNTGRFAGLLMIHGKTERVY